ncbi:MAG: glycoside hydrolase family 38 C-terminal domain-containing protein [Clostridiaceae bacterium]|nr:glycoside hydrolase family 38 C-terminal domain-containing protein [Clostridiaceae bacterium]
MVNRSLERIAGRIGLSEQAVVLANTAGFDRSELVCLPWPEDSALPVLCDPVRKTLLPVQRTAAGLVFLSPEVPAKGYCCLPFHPEEPSKPDLATPVSSLSAASHRLENRFWLIELDEQGNLSRILDKIQGRDVLLPGRKGNVFRAFEDKPMAHQNWDIDIYYQQKSWSLDEATSIEVVENGPVRAGVRITRPFLDSVLIQTLYLYDQLPRIDFDTFIDWKEDELLLKVEFPVDIHAETATYDIQFGNLTRPTHWNTSWDWARFEVCAHKWADLSEDGYGVSLMNDCKYGHDIRDSVMRLTLLKSGLSPNPHADREQHRFVYSLYPHAGGWRQARTMQQAYSLNIPLYAKIQAAEKTVESTALPGSFSLCRVDADDHVMLETVKLAEEGGGLIFRLFEYCNRRGAVRLTLGYVPKAIEECDLLERTERKLPVIGNTVDFDIKPYEIKSFRIIF